MKQTERSSIMRIVLDMVKSDAIIDTREIEFVKDVKQKYGITQDDEIAADTITMSDAFHVLQDSPESLQQDLWGDLQNMAFADNACTKDEALHLIAIAACFKKRFSGVSDVFSIELSENIKIDSSQVIYIEGEYYKETNREITTYYREIINELRLIGMNFVYIPKVGEHYRSLSKEGLKDLISFLYPGISQVQMEHVTKQLTNMSTSDFCKSEIVGRMKLDGLSHALPSIMLWIGTSILGNKTFENFLVVTIDDNIYTTIKRIVDTFVSLYSPKTLNTEYEDKHRFAYVGYYKQILDSFVHKKGIRSSVAVDLIHGEILLPEADAKINGLHRREKALYALFLLESASGGINFNKPEGAKSFEKYKHRMDVLQQKYEIIYHSFGGEKSKAPRIELSENRLPMISLIKRCFRQLGDLLNEPDDYLVQRNMFGNYCVTLPPELCLCFDGKTSQYCRFEDSEFWSKLLAM